MDAGPISVVAVVGANAALAIGWLIKLVLKERRERRATFALIAAEVKARTTASPTPRPAGSSPSQLDGAQAASVCEIPGSRRRRVLGTDVPPNTPVPGTLPRHARAS